MVRPGFPIGRTAASATARRYDREDCGVGANTQCQRNDRNNRKPRLFPEPSDRSEYRFIRPSMLLLVFGTLASLTDDARSAGTTSSA